MNEKNKKNTFRGINLFVAFIIPLLVCLFAFYGAENAKAVPPPLPPTQPWVNITVCADADLSNPYQPVIGWSASGNPQKEYWVLVDDDSDMFSPEVNVRGGGETSLTLLLGTIDLNKTQYYSVAIAGDLGWTPWSIGSFTVPRIDGQCGSGLQFCTGTTLTSATPGLCPAGIVNNIGGNSVGPWTWGCKAIGGGVDQNGCQAAIKIPVSGCGSALSMNFCPADPAPIQPSLCVTGSSLVSSPNNTTPSGYWNWQCTDTCNNPQSCQVAITTPIIPSCGTDNGKAFCKSGDRPSALCDQGDESTLSGGIGRYEDWKWTCTGTCPSTVIDCNAKGQGACGWIETN
jgi:hypothetical protein